MVKRPSGLRVFAGAARPGPFWRRPPILLDANPTALAAPSALATVLKCSPRVGWRFPPNAMIAGSRRAHRTVRLALPAVCPGEVQALLDSHQHPVALGEALLRGLGQQVGLDRVGRPLLALHEEHELVPAFSFDGEA